MLPQSWSVREKAHTFLFHTFISMSLIPDGLFDVDRRSVTVARIRTLVAEVMVDIDADFCVTAARFSRGRSHIHSDYSIATNDPSMALS